MRDLWRWLLLLAVVVPLVGAGTILAQAPTSTVGVYYVGAQDTVAQAVVNAAPYLALVDRPELADVYVLNNAPLTPAALQTIRMQALDEEVGVVVITGPLFPTDTSELRALLGIGTFGMAQGKESPRQVKAGEEADPLQEAITWRSAPAIEARTVISNPNLLLPIVTTTGGEPIVQRVRGRQQTQIFIIGLWPDDASNAAWITWPYFDYFIYRLIAEAGDAPRIIEFADYPRAPVPHDTTRLALILGGLGLFTGAMGLAYIARRSHFLKPEALPSVQHSISSEGTLSDWDRVGFHRPLASLLFLFGGWIVLFVPLLIYRTYFLPTVLIPWTQVLDFWETVTRWLSIVWIVLDMGIGVATMRYFTLNQHRNPTQGFRYLQFYVWWQFLSGAVLLTLIAGLSTLIFPHTDIAHLSYYILVAALIQFPGFLRVFQILFMAQQRFDYAQLLSLLATTSTIVLQAGTVWLFSAWGAQWSDIGRPVGSALGLGIGLYAAEWLVFAAGLILYKVRGHSLRRLFTPSHDRHVTGRTLGFGARLAFGSLAAPAGYLLNATLLSQLLPQASDLQAAWQSILPFLLAYEILGQGLYDALIPAMTESHTQQYGSLTRYYASQGVRYGLWISFFLLATLSALTGPFAEGILDGLSGSMETLLIPLLIWGALQWLPWSAERGLVALGRPALRSWLMIGEVALRLGSMLVLVPRLGIWGVVAAYLGALLLRGLVGWYTARRLGLRIYVSGWQSVIAPGGAALILYNLERIAREILWRPAPVHTLFFLLGALIAAPPIYGFLTAFLGGWDDGGLQELQRAVRLSGLGFPISWLLSQGVRLGANISPLHGQFPVELRNLAEEEAEALTFQRPLL
jgi:O-antigen/teichoic acid export membrane protein